MKTILITGINGYLGSHLAKRYAKKFRIIGLEYSLEKLSRIEEYGFNVYSSKEGIPDTVFEEQKIDIVIHTATFYGRNSESNTDMCYSNTYLPLMLLHKAMQYNCDVFINTDTVLDRLTSAYALTKKQFNDWCKFYSEHNKIKVVNLVLEHFYGPGTSCTNFITSMVQKMLKNELSIPLTKGEQNRDFLYIEDLLHVYDIILNRYPEFKTYDDFSVGAGRNTNLKYLLEYIKKETNSNSVLQYGEIPYRKNELMESQNNVLKLNSLGWKAKYSIEDGLLSVINYEKRNIKA